MLGSDSRKRPLTRCPRYARTIDLSPPAGRGERSRLRGEVKRCGARRTPRRADTQRLDPSSGSALCHLHPKRQNHFRVRTMPSACGPLPKSVRFSPRERHRPRLGPARAPRRRRHARRRARARQARSAASARACPASRKRTKPAHWHGFDVDFCKAVAAAVLGDTSKVDYRRADGGQPLRRAEGERDRPVGAQHDLDHVARPGGRARLRRHRLFRRPGFHAARAARRVEPAAARGRHHLRRHRHRGGSRTRRRFSRGARSRCRSCGSRNGRRRAKPTQRENATPSPATARRLPPNARGWRSPRITSCSKASSPRSRSGR